MELPSFMAFMVVNCAKIVFKHFLKPALISLVKQLVSLPLRPNYCLNMCSNMSLNKQLIEMKIKRDLNTIICQRNSKTILLREDLLNKWLFNNLSNHLLTKIQSILTQRRNYSLNN